MTLTAKQLWVGFGVLTAELLIFSAVVLWLLRSAEHDLALQTQIAQPRAMVAKQLEIGLLGHALAVRTFFQTRNSKYKDAVSEEAAKVERSIDEYQRLASSDDEKALANRFASAWRDYKDFAQHILTPPGSTLDETNAEELARRRMSLERFIETEMQRAANETYLQRQQSTERHLRVILRSVVALLIASLVLAAVTSIIVTRGIMRVGAAVAHEHAQLHAIIQAMADGVMVFDLKGNAIVVNDAEARLVGYRTAEEMKRDLAYFARNYEVADLDGHRLALEQWPVSRVMRGESFRDWELSVRRTDTHRQWIISFSGEPVRGPDGKQILSLVVSRDVSAQKQSEERLRDREERYRLASDVAGLAHWDWDLKAGEIHWSDEFRKVYGVPPQIPPSYEAWKEAVLPEDFPRLEATIHKAISECDGYRTEFRIRHPERGVRSLMGVGRVITDDAGKAARVIAVSMDITELKRVEEEVRRLNQSLERRVQERTAQLAEANMEMQAFSYTVSHDLRAPLRGIQGFAHALVEDFSASLGDEGKEYCQRIAAAGERMEDLIEDLLDYSRLARQEILRKPLDVAGIVSEALERLQNQINAAGASITVAAPLGTVLAHPAVLVQVIQNLVANAMMFVAEGVKPKVVISAQDMGGRVQLNVEDNGIGIEKRNLERIFQVFERLHGAEAYAGTGIGLAIVKRAMERLGGSCGVESTPGIGSRFWIELPKP